MTENKTINTEEPGTTATVASREATLFAEHQQSIYQHMDRAFAGLMLFQWLAGIGAAFWLSPLTWTGAVSRTHVHVWTALFLGGAVTLYPVTLALIQPGKVLTRHSIAVGQLLMSALLIHLTGGRIETHFHVFGSLAFLAFYRDWRVILTGTLVTAADHFLRGLWWPQSIYGVQSGAAWRWLEHAGWVVFEDIFLVLSCLSSQRELRQICQRDATLEKSNATLEREVEARTASLRATNAALENAVEGISELDAMGCFRAVNGAFARMVGYEPEVLIGMSWHQVIAHDDRETLESGFQQILLSDIRTEIPRTQKAVASGIDREAAETRTQGKVEMESEGVRRDGSLFHCEVVLVPAHDDTGAVSGCYCFMKDVSERKRLEDQIVHQAFHDALSGLPNRLLFTDRVEQALARSQRLQRVVGVMFVDLDNFKFINDSMGHEQGDQVLMEVARRLQASVRPGDTVARMGGDEFTILLENIAEQEEAVLVAERLVQRLQEPVALEARPIIITCSIGLAVSAPDGSGVENLLRDADTAMYQAKLNGKAGYMVFDRSMNDRLVERVEIETGLRRALEQDELRVFYQPIMNLEKGTIEGAEALVRWEHPQLGLVSPAKFIPIAEETGLILPIGYWVLREACLQAKAWQEQRGSDLPFIMSVNLSGRQLQDAELCSMVASILQETGLPPACLKLEITESVMIGDIEATITRLNELKALGVLLAVDDFGTGYSSLSYLQRLPVDTVKIDQSFIKVMGSEQQPAAIVNAIINLCRVMNLNVTGEGIENTDQLVQLQALGCDFGQGYLFAKPITDEAFSALMEKEEAKETRWSTQQPTNDLSAQAIEDLLPKAA